ncbi:MAG: CBS domain-containing protein [Vulcanimicrobiota bacterium]
MKKIKDILVRDITSVTSDDTMRNVARILANHRFSGIPVVDNDHRVIGFISESDVVRSEFPQMGRSPGLFLIRDFAGIVRKISKVGSQKVSDYMNQRPITIEEDDSIMDVVRLILERGVKVIPVVRDGVLVGVVGRAEICRELLESGTL